MTKTEKFNALNAAREAAGERPLKAWKKSNAALDEALAKYEVANGATEVATKPKKRSIASYCRAGFEAGLTNDEVYSILLEAGEAGQVKFDASKKWYVTWYRSHFKREAAKAAA